MVEKNRKYMHRTGWGFLILIISIYDRIFIHDKRNDVRRNSKLRF